jgi:signal transduction histidine kinase
MAATGSLLSRHPRRVVVAVLALVLAAWGTCLYSIAGQIGRPFAGFLYSHDRLVSGLTPRDLSGWQAGLRPGDYIVEINGQPWQEMRRLVREAGIGTGLKYTVLRDGQSLHVVVPTMEFTPAIPWRFLSEAVLFIATALAVSLFVYLRNPGGRLNRYVLAYFALWTISGAGFWEHALSQEKWAALLVQPGIAIACVSGWILFWSFPADQARREFLRRRPLIPAFVAIGVAACLYYPVLGWLAHRLDRPDLWRLLGMSDGWVAFAVFCGGSYVLKSIPLLLVMLGRRSDPRLRRQAGVLLVGLALGLSSFVLYIWAPFAVGLSLPPGTQWVRYLTALYPLAFGIAVLRYQLLDIRVVVRKGLVYSLLTAALTVVFLLLSLLSGYLFQWLTGRESVLSAVVPALVVALLFQPARSRIQTEVDRLFFRREVEVRRTLTDFSRGLATLHNRQEIVRLVVDTAVQTLEAWHGFLWPLDETVYCPTDNDLDAAESLAPQGALVDWLVRERRPLLAVPGDRSPAVQELLQTDAVLAVPIRVGDRLLAILVLGERKSGVLYSQEDLDLLTTLAHNAGLGLENARLHEERVAMLRRRLAEVTAAQEEERRRIARELHDGVGPSLASLSLRLHTAGKLLERDRQLAAGEIAELADVAQSNIRDIRRLIYDLRPAALDELGLVPALRDYAARWGRDQGMELVVSLPEGFERLPPPLETALFRVAQEGLANVARHAHAHRVELALDWDEVAARLRLADDGQGFDLREASEQATQGGHLGLWSMRERVEQLGGQFTLDSEPGRGTRLQMTIPRESKNGQDRGANRR